MGNAQKKIILINNLLTLKNFKRIHFKKHSFDNLTTQKVQK